MKHPLRNRCPVCGSTDLLDPEGYMPPLYAMHPTTCKSCDAKFESSLISRIGFWIFISVFFAFYFWRHYLVDVFGKDITGYLFLGFVGAGFLAVIVGCVMQLIRPWQFALWNDRNRLRAFVNYGTMASIAIFAVMYFASGGYEN